MNGSTSEGISIEAFDSPEGLAEGVAGRFSAWLSANPDARSIALSGGRISRALFATLANQESPVRERLSELHYFWADERCVPLDDPESNYRLATDLLFEPVNIAQSQRHPFAGGDSPERMVAAGQAMIQDFFQPEEGADPVFDLIFLGMGEDGHVASLFPENLKADRERTEPCFNVVASKPPPARITLSYGVLRAAKEVWCVISGAGKAEKLRDAVAGNSDVPLGCVLQDRMQTRIFTDISS